MRHHYPLGAGPEARALVDHMHEVSTCASKDVQEVEAAVIAGLQPSDTARWSDHMCLLSELLELGR